MKDSQLSQWTPADSPPKINTAVLGWGIMKHKDGQRFNVKINLRCMYEWDEKFDILEILPDGFVEFEVTHYIVLPRPPGIDEE
tara:strand:+ start:3169 stop:3417 length:249 start_codon:yes stop_codon:yes gene_type:complete